MKRLLEAVVVLSMVLTAGVEIPEEDGMICEYVENEETGDLELVCVPEEEAVCPLWICDADCWDDVL